MISDKLNKNEIKVLQSFQESTDKEVAKTITILSERTNLSYFSVRNIIKSLYLSGLCEKGRKEGNADTYYLTELGQKVFTKED